MILVTYLAWCAAIVMCEGDYFLEKTNINLIVQKLQEY